MSNVTKFQERTRQYFHEINGMSIADIEQWVSAYAQARFWQNGYDAAVVAVVISGSRCRGLEHSGSDLDIVLEYAGNEREDDIFNLLHEEELKIGDVVVDINPIAECDTETLEDYLSRVEEYLEKKKEETNE